MAAALAVTDELVLPLRTVGDLAAAAGLSREEVVIITQCASLSFHFPISRFLNTSGLNAQLLLCFIRRKFAVRQGGQEDGHKIHNLCQSSCVRLFQSFTIYFHYSLSLRSTRKLHLMTSA
jgi:hypothetical protein